MLFFLLHTSERMVVFPWVTASYPLKLSFLFCALNVLHCALMKILNIKSDPCQYFAARS